LNDIGVPKRLLLDARTIEQRAVGATEVLNDESTTLHSNLRVAARHHPIVGANRALKTPTNVNRVDRRKID
jgi:hypothetical protein